MRPRDEKGQLLPVAHIRLSEAVKLREAALLAISEGSLSAHLSLAQKLKLADVAIDHVVDGFNRPKSTGTGRPMEIWNRAVQAVRNARRKAA